MATPTRMELFPTKRESDAEHDEEAAAAATSKKAKTTEEAIPEDDSMSDSSTDEKEWIKTKLELEALRKESRLISYQDALPTIDLIRGFQLFLQLKGDADRASKIASEKDERDVFSEDEMEMFWSQDKLWHIRRQTSDNFSDYQRLAIYASESDLFYQKYFHHYYFDNDFDALYLKIADELN